VAIFAVMRLGGPIQLPGISLRFQALLTRCALFDPYVGNESGVTPMIFIRRKSASQCLVSTLYRWGKK
jgi:hypothetical protein